MARIFILGSLADSLVNFRRNLLEEMVAAGHQVYACAPDASDEIKKTLLNMGVTYQDIKLERTGMNPVKDLITLLNLVRLIKKNRPTVFLGYTIKPVIYGSFAARLAGVPYIFSMIEGLGYAFMSAGIKRKAIGFVVSILYKYALSFNKRIFFLNQDNLSLFRKKGLVREGQPVMLNGIGVDLKKFSTASYPADVSFLLIARLLRDKGVREYAEAARIIRKKYPEIMFRLVGFIDEGNPASISEAELNSWVSENVIEYLGCLSDVRQAITDTSVYVLPSYHEGMPVTVMEAMAMGRPIITTQAPGCRETVKPGTNGFLVPVRDVTVLVEAIEHFIQQPVDVERMGKESRRIAVEKYDVHKVNAVILKTMKLV